MSSKTEIEDTKASNLKFMHQLRLQHATIALTATGTITKKHPPLLFLSATAARSVKLPANSDSEGLVFAVYNTSGVTTGVLTFLTATGAATSPSIVIVQNEGVVLANNGSGWKGIVGPNT